MRNRIITTLILILIIPALLFAQNQLQKLIDSYQNYYSLRHAQWSIYAQYTDNSEVIIDFNGNASLAPASGLKLLTTAAALDLLGPDHRIETHLYYDGNIGPDGILTGNIYIKGGGDPALGSDRIDSSASLNNLMAEWAVAVGKKGIREIRGAIIADDLLFSGNAVPDNWTWGDIGNYYGAGTNALSIHDNLYFLYFKPGKFNGQPANTLRTEPVIPGLSFDNHMLTGRRGSGDRGYIYCAPGQYTATLRGTVPAGVSEFAIKGSIPDPALFTAQYFSDQLKKMGIAISGIPKKQNQTISYNSAKLIHKTMSSPIKEIVYYTNKRSMNLYAEQLLRLIALEKTGNSSIKQGIHSLYNFCENNKISTDGMHLYDGSGLSRENSITTESITQLLVNMTSHPYFDYFYNSLGIAGDPADPASFSSFGSNTILANNARLKSGTLARVRSLSGYVQSRTGRLIAFSIIANNYSGSLANLNQMHKNLIIELAKLP
ncbi:MAG: D-alanyl-D-alanine carboxypeptidase/D-alanyl-D-alanine-endopeptidase [Calditrichaceae bacterium]